MTITPVIHDKNTGNELWRVVDCAAYLDVSASAWRNYNSQGRTPKPVTNLGARMPLWDANEVKEWHANRPGSPVPNNPGQRKKEAKDKED